MKKRSSKEKPTFVELQNIDAGGEPMKENDTQTAQKTIVTQVDDEKKLLDNKDLKDQNQKDKGTTIGQFISKVFHDYFAVCKEYSIMLQVLTIYLLLMIIFLIILIFAKINIVDTLIQTQSRKSFYTSIVKEMIDIQRDVIVQLDKVNNDRYIANIEDPTLFFKLYTQELMRHNICQQTIKPFIFNDPAYPGNPDISKTLYTSIGKKDNIDFEMSDTLKNLVEKNIQGFDSKEHQLTWLIPFYYHFVPIIYQSLQAQEIPLINFYFIGIGNQQTENTQFELLQSFFMKFPLEPKESATSSKPKNDQLFDAVLDPTAPTFSYQIKENHKPINLTANNPTDKEEIMTTIKKTNWFYKIAEKEILNGKTLSKMIKLAKINEDNNKEEYLMKYIYSQYTIPKTTTNEAQSVPFLFAMKLNRTAMKWPYIILNSTTNDIQNFDYISLINYFNGPESNVETEHKIYKGDYTIDDNSTLIVNLPKFIDNLYQYTMQPHYADSETNFNIKKHIMKYSNIDQIYEKHSDQIPKYDFNPYFKQDSRFFQLLVFMNHFLNFRYFKKLNPSQTDLPFTYKDECRIGNMTEYVNQIDDTDINCLNDYCYFNDCESHDPLYIDKMNSQYLPNCYCLPFYCIDANTPSDADFPFRNKINTMQTNPSKIDTYAFNKRIMNNNEFIQIDGLANNTFQCRLFFYQRQSKEPSSFNIKAYLDPLYYDKSTTMFKMFFINNDEIDRNIIGQFNTYVEDSIWIVYLVYFLCLCIIVVILSVFMYLNVQKLTDKMKKFEDFRKQIIPMNETEGLSTKNNDKDDNDRLLKDSKKDKEKEDNNKRSDIEEDELDKIYQLVENNISNFKITFNINDNINDNIKRLDKQYYEIRNINEYKNKLLLPSLRKKPNLLQSLIKSYVKEKYLNQENVSLNMLNEMLSMSDKNLIDFSNIKTNFYYIDENYSKEPYNLFVPEGKMDDGQAQNGISDDQKINNAIRYYITHIHSFWKQKYEDMKTKTAKERNINSDEILL